MAGIFISYRKADSQHAAGRLAYELGKVFGSADIFRDVESIDPGLDFEVALDQALAGCAVMLVMVGPRWLDVTDDQGRRRLERPGDWVRTEVSVALQRGIRLIPLLVEDTPLPDEAQLPEPMRAMTKRQALPLSDGRWKGDVERLVSTLARIPGLDRHDVPEPAPAPPAPVPPVPSPTPPAPASKMGLWTGVMLGAGGLVVLALFFDDGTLPADAGFPVNQGTAAPLDSGLTEEDPPVASPVPVPVPQQGPMPASPAAPPVPDFRGMWRTLSGESYEFQQDGPNLRFSIHTNGVQVGGGRGRYADGVLRVTASLQTPNGMFNVNCDMQSSTGPDHWVGVCLGPNGAAGVQMFR